MLTLVLSLLIAQFLIQTLAEVLNLQHLKKPLPSDIQQEFIGYFDKDRYEKMNAYQQARTHFDLFRETLQLAFLVLLIVGGGFALFDRWAQEVSQSVWIQALVFAGIYGLIRMLFSLPFSIYSTFCLEERFGFNRTTPKTFVADLFRGMIMGAILGGAIFLGIVYFFEKLGPQGWLAAWIAVTVFQILLQFLAPAILLPLFNKFTPLKEGAFFESIARYARDQKFSLEGMYTMDGSKRSSKANAFFTGFGKLRRLVLFDTLIEKHSPDELTAVVAHEVGHFRLGHIIKGIITSIVGTGAILFALSRLLGNWDLFQAFGMSHISTYASLILISILLGPFGVVFSLITQLVSRKHEYEADEYSLKTFGNRDALIAALKKLSADSLSNLWPHPLKVALDYSHPPVMERVRALRKG